MVAVIMVAVTTVVVIMVVGCLYTMTGIMDIIPHTANHLLLQEL
jgi:uncharacterized membrane protein HdeD (DUF308 family)